MSDKNEIWSGICKNLESKLNDDEYKTWFSQTSLETFDFDLAVINAPNKFVANWLEDKYLPEIKNAFRDVLSQSPDIRFAHSTGIEKFVIGDKSLKSQKYESSYNLNLNPSMTFKRFIVGECNRFAYSSAFEVAKRPAEYYNPLYIYGKGGFGKTHLLHAIGNSIITKDPYCRIRYLSSDSFTTDFTYSMKNNKLHEFRSKYINLDILLFDDIQNLANRKRTQDEFLFVFNTLHDGNKQIVITGSKPPNELRNMNAQLASRLGGGLLSRIRPPDTKTKVKMINIRSKEENMQIPEDVLFFFANSVKDMKDLVNNMVRFSAYASLNGGSINISIAKSLIKNGRRVEIDIEDIKRTVSGFFNLSVADIVSNKKKRAYSYPRQLAMYLARKYTHLSYQQIGDAFYRKNHSTVIYAIRRINKIRNEEKEVKEHLLQIENLLS